MTGHTGEPVPAPFAAALASLRERRLRTDVHLAEIPGPTRIAPFSVALEGEIVAGDDGAGTDGGEVASGRFVVLHDPQGQETWHGTFRVVTLVRATLEPELAADPLLAEVAWSWVTEALGTARVAVRSAGGTVTRVVSQSFGALSSTPDAVDLEIRASWTPEDTDLGAHLAVWADLMATAGGLPPLPDGVTALSSRARPPTLGP
ncbi:DUF3000 domain-containing protein [Isoptericola sp. NEAU-Y5]|uniref:DUF3000 domain-containing protein n=1 Tax=Isoptericola luteus TaxID=2879484 RepID=A0ABS7ZFY8_9MICO|nr:DUF3000 domain-containing protein [Isoptericola sp. NEAU-Y5]MCA5893940.1 DUF3000 domain-containing protein [Isoptericola sp. NEAU-Y5]